jgi:hypothetical protein
MKPQQLSTQKPHSRCDARARVIGRDATGAVVSATAMLALGTLFTTKINPRWASGGLPREGNP